jgi:hypothetical protein
MQISVLANTENVNDDGHTKRMIRTTNPESLAFRDVEKKGE